MIVGVNTVCGGLGGIPGKPGTAAYDDHYLYRLIDTARQIQADTKFVVYCWEEEEAKYAGWNYIAIPRPRGPMSLLRGGMPNLEPAIQKSNADVLISPIEGAPLSCSVPQVLIALNLAQWFERRETRDAPEPPETKNIRRACANAIGFITPSEYYRRACLEKFQAPLNKIFVVPPGVNPVLEQRQQFSMFENPYIMLCTDASTAPYMESFLNEWDDLRYELKCNLVIFGPGGANDPKDWGADAIRIEHFPDTQLAGLFQKSKFFIYLAENEGAGVRVIEGLRAGAVTVTPENKAIAEFVGATPLFYTTTNKRSIGQTMRRAMDLSGERREKHIELGQKRVREFDWDKSAWKLLQSFKRM